MPSKIGNGNCNIPECAHSTNCNYPEVCVKGHCLIGRKTCNPSCKKGEICTAGACVRLPVTTCIHPYKWDYRSNSCTDNCDLDTECTPYFCLEGKCRVPYCSTSQDCDNGKICVDGICKSLCTNNLGCETGHICFNNEVCEKECRKFSECQESNYCDGKDSTCKQVTCFFNNDCNQPSEVCHFGTCTKRKTCLNDRHCPSHYYCVGEEGQKACIQHKPDCNTNNCLVNKKCFTSKLSLCLPEIHCYLTLQCPENMHCNKLEHKCFPNQCRETGCSDGFECFKEQCIPSVKCLNQDDCIKECSDTNTCSVGQLCKNKKCIYPDCYTNSDCVPNKKCIEGICYDVVTEIPKCIKCNGICYDGVCKELPCDVDSNCVYPSICGRHKTCEKPSCDKSPDCPMGTKCEEKKCSIITSQCKWNDKECPCKNNKDCAYPAKCKAGVCLWTCQISEECNVGASCDVGVCSERECHLDDDCTFGMYCSAGKCINVKKCSSFSDNCIEGTTLQDTLCTYDYECLKGNYCQMGICIPKGVRCRHRGHCSELMLCNSNKCEFNQCQKDTDCGQRRICKANICVPRLFCKTNADCDLRGDKVCLNMQCRKICDEYSCDSGYHCDIQSRQCKIIKNECDLYSPCPNGGYCLSSKEGDKTGKCVEHECSPHFGCSEDMLCIAGHCVDCKTNCKHSHFSCSNGNELCLPGELVEKCRRDSCPWPYKCIGGVCKNFCHIDDDCFYPSNIHGFECKENKCTRKQCQNDLCKKPSHLCKNKNCERIECLRNRDCKDEEICYLGTCISSRKQPSCKRNEILSKELLFCLPKNIVEDIVKVKIYCDTKYDCPADMKCGRNNLCSPIKCQHPIGENMPEQDDCGHDRLCITTGDQNLCSPAFECEHGTCSHPGTPKGKMFNCFFNKCYVSIHECDSSNDCDGKKVCETVIVNENQIRQCIDLGCKRNEDCKKGQICRDEQCQECISCKNNNDCYGYICSPKKCCVPTQRCTHDTNKCNSLFGIEINADISVSDSITVRDEFNFCHNRYCMYCYLDSGIDDSIRIFK